MNIILIRFNLPEIEQECIDSVKKYTDLNKHTLTIYDNYPKKEKLAVVWNRLIKQSQEDFICLLNSDTKVTKNWVEDLMEGFKKDVIAVGPSTNNCGTIQKTGKRGEGFQNLEHLSGFCLIIRKTNIFFEESVPFYGNENVFLTKAKRNGWKAVWCKKAFVYHIGGASGGKMKKEKDYRNWLDYYNAPIRTTNAIKTVEAIESKLGTQFKYTRFGDGEILGMKDHPGKITNQLITEPLREELREIFRSDSMIGCSAGMVAEEKAEKDIFLPFNYDPLLTTIVKDYGINRLYYSPIALHYLYVFNRERFNKFWNKLNKYKVTLVGGKHLKNICKDFIEIPQTQSYGKVDIDKIKNHKTDILLICGGIGGKVIQHRVNTPSIDLGSVGNAMVKYKHSTHQWIKKKIL